MMRKPSYKFKKRILFIANQSTNCTQLQVLLETKGHKVFSIKNPSEALSSLVQSIYDLVIIYEPLIGMEAGLMCSNIRNLYEGGHIPILIIGKYGSWKSRVEILNSGADDCLDIPFHINEILARIDVLVRREISMESRDYEEKILAEDLREIICKKKMQPYFQPIYQLKPFKLLGFEVLSRPITNSKLFSPENLFRAAMQCHMYCDLELMSWELALKEARKFLEGRHLFINCNPFLIQSVHCGEIQELFSRVKVSSDQVFLEITERSNVSEYDFFHEKVNEYRNLGFRIAIDDVGAGFASLETLVKTNPDVVKIDRHIIQNLHEDPIKRSLVKFVADFCRENNILTIAEGVEIKQEFDVVQELGVGAVQGYYLARPVSEVNLEKMIAWQSE